MNDSKILKNNIEHFDKCHTRWLLRRNRDPYADNYQDDWAWQQCGGCRYFVYLSGAYAEDWGVCTHSHSEFDGHVRFEHDGCDAFDFAEDGWGRDRVTTENPVA